ncbi:uncharacterized protein LOC129248064 [Anastrepha obliqua]|uniref:uncharacterized protein LOC129248064 n=1 Tax=Anastrepha obliqua TaxID=95512 RepID=UPI00240A7526|nr:uncharacterized protein LOC129248064 [Anastrepha obliqua]XP_054743466.1 uncharacterized protein LOC129248064 [Anastrepha obliqua]
MEILMKLKCSTTAPAHGNSSTHSTLKVVDHHHQLTQQHAALQPPPTTAPPSLVRLPSQANINFNSPSSLPPIALHSMPRMPTSRPCMNYSKSLDCCNAAAVQQEVEIFDLQWDQQGSRGVTYEVAMQRPPSCCTNITGSNLCESPACCTGPCTLPAYSTPPTISQSAATTPLSQPPPLQQAPSLHPPPLLYPMASSEETFEMNAVGDINTHYEYQEPEENFISIEDTKIKGLLMKIGRECGLEKRRSSQCKNKLASKEKEQKVFFEIIDLDDEDDREELRQIRNQMENSTQKMHNQNNLQQVGLSVITGSAGGGEKHKQRIKSPSISLIPKSPSPMLREEATLHQKNIEPTKERIIAHIDLSDSSDSEAEQCNKPAENVDNSENQVDVDAFDTDDEDELTFAAAAVSCELKCDDDENADAEDVNENAMANANISNDDVVILNSDDENVEFIDKHEKGLELHWDDLDRREKGRQYFECYLCGKKVQSSYNLRRHMMIHTGERPFGCDMCDRRFREFSDLKKHRRRHSNEANFVCMVCRSKPPMLQDPTRCNDCDSKTSAITAAMRTQLSSSAPPSPEKRQTPPLPTPPPPPPPPQLTKKPLQPTGRLRDTPAATTVTSTATSSSSNVKTLSKPTSQPTTYAVSPKHPSPTPLLNSDMPSLVPINAPITVNKTVTTSAQLLLDNIPVVHRPNYNQLGVITRKEFPCPLCQRPFGTRHNLKRHFMIHTGEKPFSCNKCRKPFREYSTLKKHMVTHQRDRYYKCLHCPRKYRDYLDYSEHKKTHANEDDDDDDDDINFDQQHLSSSSSTSSPQKRAKTRYDSSYDSNEEDSSTEDWLECCECKHRFTEIEAYTKHLKEHDPSVYLYECYICKKTFEQRDELVEHVSACKEELRETALQRATCFN